MADTKSTTTQVVDSRALANSPTVQITTIQLNGEDFFHWSQSVRMYIRGKGENGYITREKTTLSPTDPSFVALDVKDSRRPKAGKIVKDGCIFKFLIFLNVEFHEASNQSNKTHQKSRVSSHTKPRHTCETCWKLHGKLANWRSSKEGERNSHQHASNASFDQSLRETIGHVKMIHLYYFDEPSVSHKVAQGLSCVSSPSAKETIMLWNCRLEHPNFFYLKFPAISKLKKPRDNPKIVEILLENFQVFDPMLGQKFTIGLLNKEGRSCLVEGRGSALFLVGKTEQPMED
ncbi:uncharacterized protein E5676_scaffold45G00480 [Cucumis melo var. makuwa]|uniref:Retrotransposon Copia-like N-terminal domain-containing protein n=1 Tax=Cucumis melo var. makuwa TaxID=1194695 RepID=A0A5D3CVQ3_CUCMM|nr:uncharacterized protein E5676_scaffold45G00480 [Cucumis melo var. makuwa]